jgi:hypothetical protein
MKICRAELFPTPIHTSACRLAPSHRTVFATYCVRPVSGPAKDTDFIIPPVTQKLLSAISGAGASAGITACLARPYNQRPADEGRQQPDYSTDLLQNASHWLMAECGLRTLYQKPADNA